MDSLDSELLFKAISRTHDSLQDRELFSVAGFFVVDHSFITKEYRLVFPGKESAIHCRGDHYLALTSGKEKPVYAYIVNAILNPRGYEPQEQ